MRRDEPERARGLLEALGVWPLYKGGQFLFDLLEWEDFMLAVTRRRWSRPRTSPMR